VKHWNPTATARDWLRRHAERSPVTCGYGCGRTGRPTTPGGLPLGWAHRDGKLMCWGCRPADEAVLGDVDGAADGGGG